ncbi:carbohydrate-binding family 9-like protein [Bacillus sp. FSL K6-3431]|uniref:carbohydrate-binding family 9-like protein n=1 Tax=Bacillus sp. FSL K6-3431 TaxID=2921500 RepID=UPI0030F6192A
MKNAIPEPTISTYSPNRYLCQKTNDKPNLNGRLDKLFWEKAPWSENFVDIEGNAKPIPTKQTRVKMLWDDEYFYFGAELIEDEIWATLTERDAVIFHDNDFEIFIDPDGDTHNYYEFEINALNTVWDLLLVKPYRDGGPSVNGWDINGMKTAVYLDGKLNDPSNKKNNRKWSIEVAMPWNILKECAKEGRPPKSGEFWRVNFSRVQWQVEVKDGKYVKKINPLTGKPFPEDNWVWSPMGIINMHYPELWGYVFFTDKPDKELLAIPEDESKKWQLRKVYYLERRHFSEHGSFTTDVGEELKRELPEEFKIETTSRTFLASLQSSEGNRRIYIREDGKVWEES